MLEENRAVDEEHNGWIRLLRRVEKTPACRDPGSGAMRELESHRFIEVRLKLPPGQRYMGDLRHLKPYNSALSAAWTLNTAGNFWAVRKSPGVTLAG